MYAVSRAGRARDREDIMSVLRTLAVAAAVLAAATLGEARSAMAADGDKLERSVSVSASGTVTAEPDIAHVSAGVTTEGDTAKDAIARNNAVMAKLIDGLKAGGIGARDIQTTTLHVEPRYSQPKDGRPGTISGYRVVNQVRLTVREVKRLGDLLDQAIALGANQINSIGFDIANAETLKDEARKQAMVNARRRAELYAAAAGVQLGQVLRISENIEEAASRPFAQGRAMAASVPIEAGTHTLTVEVHVTYALR
jgi:uncharacterized protein YggE